MQAYDLKKAEQDKQDKKVMARVAPIVPVKPIGEVRPPALPSRPRFELYLTPPHHLAFSPAVISPFMLHTIVIRVRGRPTATRTAKARKSSLRQPRRDA